MVLISLGNYPEDDCQGDPEKQKRHGKLKRSLEAICTREGAALDCNQGLGARPKQIVLMDTESVFCFLMVGHFVSLAIFAHAVIVAEGAAVFRPTISAKMTALTWQWEWESRRPSRLFHQESALARRFR